MVNEKTETIRFNPSFALATYENVRNGKRYLHEPQAQLTFPNMDVALDFINTGLDEEARRNPVTMDYLKDVRETPVGPHNSYDAFVRPDHATGEVQMFIRHYGPRGTEDHGALSLFVMDTIQKMPENQAALTSE